jgi:hypothetical protein
MLLPNARKSDLNGDDTRADNDVCSICHVLARFGECQETIVLECGTGVIGAVISGENVPTYFPCTASSNGWYRLRPNDDVQRIELGVRPTMSFFFC